MWKRMLAFVMAILLVCPFAFLSASSAEEQKLTLSLKVYSAETAPPDPVTELDPLKLHENQTVTVAIQYSGLDAARSGGIQCLMASFCYDAKHFQLLEFEELGTGTDSAAEWTTAHDRSNAWIPETLRNCYTGSASMRRMETDGDEAEKERDIRRIYVQYIAEDFREEGDILKDNEGYVAAFTFRVLDKFPEAEGVKLTWYDYGFGLYKDGSTTEATNLRSANAAEATYFEPPTDLPVATAEAGEGVTVSGEVFAYAPQREGVVALYPYVDGKEPEFYDKTTAGRPLLATPYQGTVGGPDEAVSSSQRPLSFTIDGVPEGTYLLVVKKPGNTHFVIKNLVVGTDNVDLTDTAKYSTEVNLMTLRAGDIDGNGEIESADAETVYLPSNWGQNNPDEICCDLDGNGTVESADVETIFLPANWGLGDVIITLEN